MEKDWGLNEETAGFSMSLLKPDMAMFIGFELNSLPLT
jgi:hypothetical protein